MDRVEDVLRRLALSDEGSIESALGAESAAAARALDPRTEALVRLGALVSIGARPASYRLAVERAYSAGATDEEILGVLAAVGPVVGCARLVAAAPDLALAIGYDVESALDSSSATSSSAP